MLNVALIGLGKMGLSHLAIINSHPDVKLVAICDTGEYILDTLAKYTGTKTYTSYTKLLEGEELDAVFVATPSRFHAEMVEACLKKGLHVFCEKPFCLDPSDGRRLAELAESRGLVNQVGYHNRFVGSFMEMKRLIDLKVIGDIHHVRAEAYGPVVLRAKGKSWRSSKTEGGGSLYDYACHAIDLMNYMVGRPSQVGSSVLSKIFSADVEDEVYTTFTYNDRLSGQLSVNWSDESNRKMTTRLTLWGTKGKIYADRQEIQLYLRSDAGQHEGYRNGWNVKYTTELTPEVWFYLRGEEYSAQIDHFVSVVRTGGTQTRSTFRSATDADLVAAAIVQSIMLPKIAVTDDCLPFTDVESASAAIRPSLWARLRG